MDAKEQPLFEVSGLNQFYGGSHILRDVSLTVKAGEITAVLGRNGVGKSSLLRTIMGLVPSKSGQIIFRGQDITKAKTYVRAQEGLAYVPQGREIFPRLTVTENLQMGLAYQPSDVAIPEDLYDLFPVLKQMAKRRGGDLSGGQQQQLAIARALTPKPTLLILDEPTEGIQPNIIKDIGRVIRLLAKERGMGILLVEQYYDFATELCDQFVLLERGAVVAKGNKNALLRQQVRERMSI